MLGRCISSVLLLVVVGAPQARASDSLVWDTQVSEPREHAEPVLLAQATAGGSLTVQSVAASVCPGESAFFTGQSVRLIGSGFTANTIVQLYFASNSGAFSLIGTQAADSVGGLNATVVIPAGLSAPALGRYKAVGATGGSGTLGLGAMIRIVGSPGPDGDGDGVPDLCDNCPTTSNANQLNSDSDKLGDLCDSCKFDPGNDSDGDGQCADMDVCPFDPNNDADVPQPDGVCGDVDNCPGVTNSNQLDQDANGIGDACQSVATCSDGVDNDHDTYVDYSSDPGCSDANDTSEISASLPCDDGVDNDADALTDGREVGYGDPGCATPSSPSESPACDDGIDNDGDGKVDWDGDYGKYPSDPQCLGLGFVDSEAATGGGC